LGNPLEDFMRPLLIANSPSGYREPACAAQATKWNPLVMHNRKMEPACDAQMAKENLRKLTTSDFSEHSANYAVFSAIYIKILY
jgi:hypothetical protein